MRKRAVLLLLAVQIFRSSAAAQSSDDAQGFRVSPTGYVQFDYVSFPNWPVAPSSGRLNREEWDVRRLRAGLDGEWRRMTFEVSVDPLDEDGVFVKDAWAEFQLNPDMNLRTGQFKLPGTREYLQSARNTDLIERTAFTTSLGVGRDLGVMLTGDVGAVEYQAGLFAGDGMGRNDRASLTSAGRLVWPVFDGLELGMSVTVGRIRAGNDSDPENGYDGRAPSGYRFFERLYVQGRRVRVMGDAEWTVGPFRFTAEGLRLSDERKEQGIDFDDLPPLIGTGWSTTGVWDFGTRRDVVLRYESLEFDDNGPATSRDSVRPRASDVRARGAQTLTLGISWGPTQWLRLLGNAGMERYSEARSAPAAGQRGNYYTLSTRVQFELP